LNEDDPENYYFEREWRILGNLWFEITDINRVIIPESYAKKFIKDIPEYSGQLTFV
jgi:hypothetical protein